MCESNVYNKNGNLLMEDAMFVDIDGEKIAISNILNEKRIVFGKITQIDLEEHKIIIEERE